MNRAAAASLPLCVDCDGSLIRTDLLHENVFALLKARWFMLLWLPFWLLQGKATLKRKLAEHAQVDAATLPYNEALVAWLRQEKARGRKIVLATASDVSLANRVAAHLGVFDEVMASDGGVNLAGAEKARQLSARYGERGFDYVGNSEADMAVWRQAHGAVVAGSSHGMKDRAAGVAKLLQVFQTPRAELRDYLKALRLHQWLKNLLVLLPALAAHRISDPATLGTALLAMLSFGLCASSVYVLNDLLDLPSDRAHPRKCKRPFASGRLPVAAGAVMIPLLLAGSLAAAWTLHPAFKLVLLAYLLATVAYSVRLKNHVVIDVILLAGLYTTRVVAGAAATQIVPSFWLLAFSMFLFFSLALVKRYAELFAALKQDKTGAAGRGYVVDDLPLLMALGLSSAMAALMVLALYVNSPDVIRMYAQPVWLWLLVPLNLYWVSRVWMKSHRGQMHDDPVVFAVRDVQSLVVFLSCLVVMLLAMSGVGLPSWAR